MRYRQLSATGDYQFGTGVLFLSNIPQAVAQAIQTRLRLLKGEWFLDTSQGLNTDLILGVRTQGTRDIEIKRVILETQGVKELLAYSSNVQGRSFIVTATVDTVYGQTTIMETF
jgi:hypothetical protein